MADAPASAPSAAPSNGAPRPPPGGGTASPAPQPGPGPSARPNDRPGAAPTAPNDAKPPTPPWEKLGLVHRKEGDKEFLEREVDDGRGGKRKVAIDLSDPDSFFRNHEFGTAGRKAQSEAEKFRKEKDKLAADREAEITELRAALADPKTRRSTLLALARAAGAKDDEVYQDILAEHERVKSMTPEQREIEALRGREAAREAAIAEAKKADETEKATAKQKAQAEETAKLAEHTWSTIGKAIEAAGLPAERLFHAQVTLQAAAADARGETNIDFGAAAKRAHGDYVKVMPAVLEKMPDTDLLATVGDKAIARIVKLYAERARNGGAAPVTGDRRSAASAELPEGAVPQRKPSSRPFVP